MHLSKSLYTRAIQCPKALWLKKYKPSVLIPPDASTQAVFETGNAVGELACQLFPDGREVPFSREYDEMLATTKQWLDEGVQHIYEATFSYNGILVMVDILRVTPEENRGRVIMITLYKYLKYSSPYGEILTICIFPYVV